MALALMRYSINGQHGNGGIINTNNIEKLVNGEIFIFNQLYYNGSFITVRTMEQLYILLAKLENGVIQDGSA